MQKFALLQSFLLLFRLGASLPSHDPSSISVPYNSTFADNRFWIRDALNAVGFNGTHSTHDTLGFSPIHRRFEYENQLWSTCKASVMCHTINNCCQKAERKIKDNMLFGQYVSGSIYTYLIRSRSTNTHLSGKASVCQHVCGIFMQGPERCEATGADIKLAIRYLRSHGCKKCGVLEGSNGCRLKIDYVTRCKDGGLQYLGFLALIAPLSGAFGWMILPKALAWAIIGK